MKKLLILTAPVILLVLTMIQVVESKEDARSRLKAKLRKPDVIDQKFIAANNWKYALRSNGSFLYDPNDIDHDGNNAGGIFPRTENQTLIYATGLYIGTLKNGIPVVSEIEYNSEFQPGRIIVTDNILSAEDPSGKNQNVFVIDQNMIDSDWPDDAPRDRFGNPRLLADAQTWMVFNDLDTSLSHQDWLIGAPDDNPGLGIEVTMETFVFAFNPLSNSIFFKVTINNRSSENYSNTYFGIWCDQDLNDRGDDALGCDTARNLAFAYESAFSVDPQTAVGFDFLQGPLAAFGELPSKEVEKFKNNTKRLDYDSIRNTFTPIDLPANTLSLGMTSFPHIQQGASPRTNLERYNLMKGLYQDGEPRNGKGSEDYYAWRGNPLSPGAETDPDVFTNNYSRRLLLNTGPFTMNAGSSQEIWFALHGAEGNSRLDALRNLFKTDDIVQSVFNQGLVTPQPPEIPQYSVSTLDNRVVLTWQSNAEYSEDIAGDVFHITTDSGYSANYIKRDFQGYRVYRSRTGLDGSFALLAQYDKIDSLGIISNRRINAEGHLEIEDIDLGDNIGLQYQFIDSNLTNTQKYFYSVTAYDAQPYIATSELITVDGLTIQKPAGIPVSLESSILANIHSATPMIAPASALKNILVVPNPFYLTAYQTSSAFNKQLKFTKLPPNCSIKIFTVSGDLVKIIYHNASSDNERPGFNPYNDNDPDPIETSTESWNLTNHRGKLVASGMYIALVEAPGIGKTTVKFAVIQ